VQAGDGTRTMDQIEDQARQGVDDQLSDARSSASQAPKRMIHAVTIIFLLPAMANFCLMICEFQPFHFLFSSS